MKKIIISIFILSLLNCNSLFNFSNTKDCFYPKDIKLKAIQKSNQRTERKGSTNGSLK